MYASIERARAAGAVGTDAQVTAALSTARALIDAFTGQWWEPTAATVVARVGHDGLALLPFVVQSVDSVTSSGGMLYPTTGYRVRSSTVVGDFDAVQLGATSWADPLVVGAEPWNGGWANLLGRAQDDTVRVVGTFGHTTVPAVVEDAAAALAAWRTTGGTMLPASGPATDDEGNAVSITVDASTPPARSRTTGVESVDAALQPLVRQLVRFG